MGSKTEPFIPFSYHRIFNLKKGETKRKTKKVICAVAKLKSAKNKNKNSTLYLFSNNNLKKKKIDLKLFIHYIIPVYLSQPTNRAINTSKESKIKN